MKKPQAAMDATGITGEYIDWLEKENDRLRVKHNDLMMERDAFAEAVREARNCMRRFLESSDSGVRGHAMWWLDRHVPRSGGERTKE